MPQFSSEVWIAIVLGVAALAYMMGRASRNADRDPLAESAAAASHYAALPAGAQVKIDQLLREKKLIEAIKVARDESTLDLKASKEAVDWRRSTIGG